MIRRGRSEGWLGLPRQSLVPWANQQGIQFNGVRLGQISGREDQGFAVIATTDIPTEHEQPLIVVPRDLIISKDRCKEFAAIDRHLQLAYGNLLEFVETSRAAILVFLIYNITLANPHATVTAVDQTDISSFSSPFLDYIKALPEELLPTLWHKDERALLTGTTLRPAIEAKLRSLLKEFEVFRERTKSIPWCQHDWWPQHNPEGEPSGLAFSDWLQVDAMYRSRALEYPGIGDAMAPCIDMANHAANEDTIALYESEDISSDGSAVDPDKESRQGNSILVMRNGKSLKAGEEVTITYGDKKGACEMAFSYGFIEPSMETGKELFLNLSMQDDDPLAPAKLHVATMAPGVRVYETPDQSVDWESDYVWLIVLNEEDGLTFRPLVTEDGARALQTLWNGDVLQDVTSLRERMDASPLLPVFQLRAAALISGRVDAQLEELRKSSAAVSQASYGTGTNIREGPYRLALHLRRLEGQLLEKMRLKLKDRCDELMATEAVQQYLSASFTDDEISP